MLTNTYIVQKGDTLYSIAAKLGTTVQELKNINNLTSNSLSIGQVLKIPTEEIYEEEETLYTVKAGDSMHSIAQEYGIKLKSLYKLNGIEYGTPAKVGQKLKLHK